MSGTLDHVIACQERLISALDSRNAAALEAATAELADALTQLRANGAVYQTDSNRLDHALRQSEAARIRVNVLADWTRQRIDRLAEYRGTGGGAYGRTGLSPSLR